MCVRPHAGTCRIVGACVTSSGFSHCVPSWCVGEHCVGPPCKGDGLTPHPTPNANCPTPNTQHPTPSPSTPNHHPTLFHPPPAPQHPHPHPSLLQGESADELRKTYRPHSYDDDMTGSYSYDSYDSFSFRPSLDYVRHSGPPPNPPPPPIHYRAGVQLRR